MPDSRDGALLALENVFQRAIVLQPLLCVEVSGFNQIIENIKAILKELTEIEDMIQRKSRCCTRGRPTICIIQNRNCEIC